MNRVRKAVLKLSKFAWSFRKPLLLTWENSYTPNIENRYKMSKSKLPTFATAGSVTRKVFKTNFRLLALLTNLIILATLKIITIVVAPAIFI